MQGLFATRRYEAGVYVTRYDVERETTTTESATTSAHRLGVPGSGGKRVLVGIAEPRAGVGGGSFVKDAVDLMASVHFSDESLATRVVLPPGAAYNVDYVVVVSAEQFDAMRDGRATVRNIRAVVMRTRTAVDADSEFFVEYGKKYWIGVIQQALIEFRASIGNPVPLSPTNPACLAERAVSVDTDAARTLPKYLALRTGAKGIGVYACARLRAAVFLDQYQGRVSLEEPPDTDSYVVESKFRDVRIGARLVEGVAHGTVHYISAANANIDSTLEAVVVTDDTVYSVEEQQSNWTRYINSATPGTEEEANVIFNPFNGRVHVETKRVIEEGEELLLDYGRAFFDDGDAELRFSVFTFTERPLAAELIAERWGAELGNYFGRTFLPSPLTTLQAGKRLIAVTIVNVPEPARGLMLARVQRAEWLRYISAPERIFDRLLFFHREYVQTLVPVYGAFTFAFPATFYNDEALTQRLRAGYGFSASGERQMRPFTHAPVAMQGIRDLLSAMCGDRGASKGTIIMGNASEYTAEAVFDGPRRLAVGIYSPALGALVYVCLDDEHELSHVGEADDSHDAIVQQIVDTLLRHHEPMRVGSRLTVSADTRAVERALRARNYRKSNAGDPIPYLNPAIGIYRRAIESVSSSLQQLRL